MNIRKNIHLGVGLMREIMNECERLDRDASYLIRLAWKIARDEVRKMPPKPKKGRMDADKP